MDPRSAFLSTPKLSSILATYSGGYRNLAATLNFGGPLSPPVRTALDNLMSTFVGE